MRRQLQLVFHRRGGKRLNAGRKPNGHRAGVSHLTREALARQVPVHVTMKVGSLPSLRTQRLMAVLRRAFAGGKDRFGFRLVHFSVQRDHLHLVVEAANKRELSRGVQGLSIRIAGGVNVELGRGGKVFADRYHARSLKTPREVRNALRYVLLNARKHKTAQLEKLRGLDPCSSADVFDGWRASSPREGPESRDLVIAPKTWLLRVGWRRGGGLLSPIAMPGC